MSVSVMSHAPLAASCVKAIPEGNYTRGIMCTLAAGDLQHQQNDLQSKQNRTRLSPEAANPCHPDVSHGMRIVVQCHNRP